MQALSDLWKRTSQEEKDEYNRKYKEAVKRYEVKLKEFKDGLNPDTLNIFQTYVENKSAKYIHQVVEAASKRLDLLRAKSADATKKPKNKRKKRTRLSDTETDTDAHASQQEEDGEPVSKRTRRVSLPAGSYAEPCNDLDENSSYEPDSSQQSDTSDVDKENRKSTVKSNSSSHQSDASAVEKKAKKKEKSENKTPDDEPVQMDVQEEEQSEYDSAGASQETNVSAKKLNKKKKKSITPSQADDVINNNNNDSRAGSEVSDVSHKSARKKNRLTRTPAIENPAWQMKHKLTPSPPKANGKGTPASTGSSGKDSAVFSQESKRSTPKNATPRPPSRSKIRALKDTPADEPPLSDIDSE
jgi:hypothetical protein